DLPAATVQLGYGQCRQGEVVGQEHKSFVVVLVEEAYPAKLFRVVLPGIVILGSDNLVALHSRSLVHWQIIEALEPEVVFGPDDEESPCLMYRMKSGKVDIAPVHDVDGTCFDLELIEDLHFVSLAVGNDYHCRYASLEIQECVEFYRSFVLPELCPGKERQAEIDDSGVQCIHRLIQFHAEGLAHVE